MKKEFTQCPCGQFYKSCGSCQTNNKSNQIRNRVYQADAMKRKKEKTISKEDALIGANEIKSDGILYKPKGCKMNKGTYKDGCGICGKGNHEKCLIK